MLRGRVLLGSKQKQAEEYGEEDGMLLLGPCSYI